MPSGEGVATPPRPRGQRAVNLFKALIVNAVPLWGLARSGWAGSTLLCLYWAETLLGTLLNGVRIAAHRVLTGKRGHFQPSSTAGGRRANGFLREYVGIALLFTLFHGVLLAGLLLLMARNFHQPPPDPRALGRGVAWLAGAMLLSLAIDLWRIRRQPFSWVRRLRDVSVQRVFLVHVTIILGAVLMAWRGTAAAFFVLFAVLKLALDVFTAFGTDDVPATPPRWIAFLVRRLDARRDADALWRKTVLDQRAGMARDEETLPPA